MRPFLTLVVVGAALALSGCGGSSNNTVVVMETSMGPVKIELFDEEAPLTVKNFLKYADDKHYDDTYFHRVIPTFMIQGGALTPDGKNKPSGMPIKNEANNGLSNKRGTVAMARTGDPHSATDMFFINVVDNDFLDRAKAQDKFGYCVFGKVIEGMETVDKIRSVRTKMGSDGDQSQPVEPVVIKSIRRVNEASKEKVERKG